MQYLACGSSVGSGLLQLKDTKIIFLDGHFDAIWQLRLESSQRKLLEYMCSFIVSTVPAGDIAPLLVHQQAYWWSRSGSAYSSLSIYAGWHLYGSCQPLYTILKSMIWWSKWTPGLNVDSMWMTYYVQISHYRCYPKEITIYHQRVRKMNNAKMVYHFNNKTVAMHFCSNKKCMDPALKLGDDPVQFPVFQRS